MLEAVSARVGLGPFTLPYLTVLVLHHRGAVYDVRSARRWLNRSVSAAPRRYALHARTPEATIRLVCEGVERDTVALTYQDPSGYTATCHNTKLASLTLELQVRGAAPIKLVSRRAALETLGLA